MKKVIAVIVFVILLSCGAAWYDSTEKSVNDTEVVENISQQQKQYEHRCYAMNIGKDWTVEEPYVFQTKFFKDGKMAMLIEVNEECGYCYTTDSIITNMFGLHGEAVEIEEDTVGEYTKIKAEIAYVASAAEQEKSIMEQPNELHYIFTDNERFVLDVYVNTEVLSEEDIDELIGSLIIKNGEG